MKNTALWKPCRCVSYVGTKWSHALRCFVCEMCECPINTPPIELTPPRGAAAEVRVVDPQTGGAKGSKPARFDMIPPDVWWELAEHYGKGEAKYPGDESGANWQKGYTYDLSIAALERHFQAWRRGEDVDPETGSSHLIAVIWHAIALRWFQLHGRGRDGRWVHAPERRPADASCPSTNTTV